MGHLAMEMASILPKRIRMMILAKNGVVFGNNSEITRRFYIDNPRGLQIGDNVFVNYGVHFHCGAQYGASICLEDNVYIGPDARLCIPSHEIGSNSQRAGKNTYKPIIIEKGAWIGACALVLGGVTIGEGSVVAAGAVVINDIPDNELWGGVPAKYIKALE